jgi:hypothetical protein
MAKPSGDYIPLGGFVLVATSAIRVPTPREIFRPRRDVERRAVGHTTINRDMLMIFTRQDLSYAESNFRYTQVAKSLDQSSRITPILRLVSYEEMLAPRKKLHQPWSLKRIRTQAK